MLGLVRVYWETIVMGIWPGADLIKILGIAIQRYFGGSFWQSQCSNHWWDLDSGGETCPWRYINRQGGGKSSLDAIVNYLPIYFSDDKG